jgi:hypothetical protein
MKTRLRTWEDLDLPAVADGIPDAVVEQGGVILEVVQTNSDGLAGSALHQINEFGDRLLKSFGYSNGHLSHFLNLTKLKSSGKAA